MTRAERPVQLIVWAVVLVVVGVLAPVITDSPRPSAAPLRHAAARTVSSTSSTSTSTSVVAPTTSMPPPRATTTPTTAITCRDSFDLRCGPFRWDPAPPANRDGAAYIVLFTASPHVGKPVTFQIFGADPDNTFTPAVCGVYSDTKFGDGINDVADCYRGPICRLARGAWTPPPPVQGSYALTREHTYAEPGTYTASVELISNRYGVSLQGTNDGPGDASGNCIDPYASRMRAETTFTVIT